MSRKKPANQDLSQQYTGLINASELEGIYEGTMDALLSALGRTVRFYLEPGRSATSANPEQYNPFTGGQDRRLGKDVETGNKGYVVEPIYVEYKAHVRYGPQPLSEDTQFELRIGDVQLTTVYGALNDILQAYEVEVDGFKFIRKVRDERPIGFSTPKYLITVWEKKTNG
jgi:hypothetical protein